MIRRKKRRRLRRLRRLVTLAAAGAAVARFAYGRRRPAAPAAGPADWAPLGRPTAPAPDESPAGRASDGRPAAGLGAAHLATDAEPSRPAETDDRPWVDPVDGACPVTHPVKGTGSSHIYHLPGGRFYEQTIPERCYRDAAAAEADGMRASKR